MRLPSDYETFALERLRVCVTLAALLVIEFI